MASMLMRVVWWGLEGGGGAGKNEMRVESQINHKKIRQRKH